MSYEARRGIESVAKLTGGRFATQLVLLVTAVVVPRVLGVEAYGTYAAWMAVVALLASVSAFGLPMVEARFLPPLWRAEDREQALELGSTIWTARLGLALVAGLLATVVLALSPRLGVGTMALVLVGLMAVFTYANEATIGLLLPFERVGTLSLFLLLRAALALPVLLIAFRAGGLAGIFGGLAALHAGLTLLGGKVLRGVARLSPLRFHWPALRPYVGFAAATFISYVAWRVQGQLPIYAVASSASREQAAYLALGLQGYTFSQLLYLTARRALTPVLGEMESRGESRRVRDWAALAMRYTAAVGTLAVLGWALVGDAVVRLAFTDAYAPVHAVVTRILICVLFYCCAEICNLVLFVQGRARWAATTMTVYAAVTLVGLYNVLRSGNVEAAYRVAGVYAAAAVVYFALSYLVLAWAGSTWLSLRRTLLLALPAAAALLPSWEAPLAERALALAALVPAYVGTALLLGLLSVREMRDFVRLVRRGGPPQEEGT